MISDINPGQVTVTFSQSLQKQKQQPLPFSLFRWTGTSLLMLLLSSSVDSLRTSVGSLWASQSATLLSDAIIAAWSVLRSLPPAPPLAAPLFLQRGLWWSDVNFETWSLMVTFPGEVLSNSMVNEAWPWAVKKTLQFCYCVSQAELLNIKLLSEALFKNGCTNVTSSI